MDSFERVALKDRTCLFIDGAAREGPAAAARRRERHLPRGAGAGPPRHHVSWRGLGAGGHVADDRPGDQLLISLDNRSQP